MLRSGREALVFPMTRIAIEHGLVLTMDRTGRIIEDGRVVVRSAGRVSATGWTLLVLPELMLADIPSMILTAECR
jgi:cytosine/adenosine deaminase-related metal-dependent hydrolase